MRTHRLELIGRTVPDSKLATSVYPRTVRQIAPYVRARWGISISCDERIQAAMSMAAWWGGCREQDARARHVIDAMIRNNHELDKTKEAQLRAALADADCPISGTVARSLKGFDQAYKRCWQCSFNVAGGRRGQPRDVEFVAFMYYATIAGDGMPGTPLSLTAAAVVAVHIGYTLATWEEKMEGSTLDIETIRCRAGLALRRGRSLFEDASSISQPTH